MNDLTTKLAEALDLVLDRLVDRNEQDEAHTVAIEALRKYEQAKAQPVQDLPPLPEPVASQQLRRHNISGHERWFGFDAINPPHDKVHYAMAAARPRDLYTAEQMRDYALAALAATPEPAPADLMTVVEHILEEGHLNTEMLGRLRIAWENSVPGFGDFADGWAAAMRSKAGTGYALAATPAPAPLTTASRFDCATGQERAAFFKWFDYAFDPEADEMALNAFAAGLRAGQGKETSNG